MSAKCTCDNDYTDPHLPGCPLLLENLERASGLDQDPATEQWRKAMERSTGARLREALEANDALAKELGRTQAALAKEREQSDELAIRLDKVVRQRDSLARRLAVRFYETERLRAQLAVRPGGQYHLTDKGLAAIAEPTDKEQP